MARLAAFPAVVNNVLLNNADFTADMSAETAPPGLEKPGGAAGGGSLSNAFAGSIAVANAVATSLTTVANTARVHAGRTVNVRALGGVDSSAEAGTSLAADGTAAVSLALQFSKANIVARVDGTVTADMNTPGGEVVKMEFDPTTTDPNKVG